MRLLATALGLLLAACGSPADVPDPAAQVVVTVGQAYADRGGTRLPVEIENKTGKAQPYIKVTCAFYDEAGALVESAFTGSRDVPAGARVTAEVLPDTLKAARVDCVPSL